MYMYTYVCIYIYIHIRIHIHIHIHIHTIIYLHVIRCVNHIVIYSDFFEIQAFLLNGFPNQLPFMVRSSCRNNAQQLKVRCRPTT